jgi:Acyl-CoA thioester hydrolase/BAAT N-terminal region/BAAT / Acyl-CoA thioester hydrolase C terminal
VSETQQTATSATAAGSAPAHKEAGRARAALGSALAFVVGFAPWVAYWILSGNTPFVVAALVALGLSLVVNVVGYARSRTIMVLDGGTSAVFAIFVILGLVVSEDFTDRWGQALSNFGLFAIVLVSVLIGKPFTLQYARKSAPPEMWDEPGFLYVTRLLAWVWVAVLGFMTVVSAIPPAVQGSATIDDEGSLLSILCYWVLPYAALALGMIFTSKYPDWFGEAAGGDDAPRAIAPPAPQIPLSPAADALRPIAADGVRLDVDPLDAPADAPVAVRVTGVPAGAEVEVAAETVDVAGHRWRSLAVFRAGANGSIDAGADRPTSGSWRAADPGGLLWSMTFTSVGAQPEIFLPSTAPAATLVTAAVGRDRVQATLVRRLMPPSVTVQDVRGPGVVGRLYLPEGDALPGVVLFPGSEGGLDSQGSNAALLAGHGCAVLVVAPYTADGPPLEGVPTAQVRVPLERYGDALSWLAGHDRIDPRRLSAMAISRGSEGLLAALTRLPGLPALRQVVAVSPSSATWEALGGSGPLPGIPAWTAEGQDVPCASVDNRALFRDIATSALRRRGNTAAHGPALLHLVRAYAGSIDDSVVTGAAAIRAEDIAAPLLLVAGEADEVWPSHVMAQRLLDRRRTADNAAAGSDVLLTYPDCGHLIRLGLWPTTAQHTSGIGLGGTAEGLAAAQADVTPRIVQAMTGAPDALTR